MSPLLIFIIIKCLNKYEKKKKKSMQQENYLLVLFILYFAIHLFIYLNFNKEIKIKKAFKNKKREFNFDDFFFICIFFLVFFFICFRYLKKKKVVFLFVYKYAFMC